MTMLKGVSVSLFLAACLALYFGMLVLVDPTLPGAGSVANARMAYSCAVLLLGLFCCLVSGLTWGYASPSVRPGTGALTALFAWFVLLLAAGVRLALTERLPL
jgi:hypothetical protein